MKKPKKQESPLRQAYNEFFFLTGGYGTWCPIKMLEVANKYDVPVVELESLWFDEMELAENDYHTK